MTNAVQTLAGVLLPSATVFLLLLSNDRAVLGPWVNSRAMNLFTGAVVAVLVMLSVILTASVLFPDLDEKWIIGVLAGGGVLAWSVVIEPSCRRELSCRGRAVVSCSRRRVVVPPSCGGPAIVWWSRRRDRAVVIVPL